MRANMSKTFNKKAVYKILSTEDKFIADIFSIMPLSMNTLAEQNAYLTEEEPTEKADASIPNEKIKRANTFEELHSKIEELKGIKKLGYKEKLVKKCLENKIRRKTKYKERLVHKKVKREKENGLKIKTKNKKTLEIPNPKIPKPVFNSEGKMVFSKFDFSEIGVKKKLPKNNPKKALQQLQEKKEKLKQLEESGDKEKAEDIKERDTWKSALARANGEKVKDDPELLKRSIKRQDQRKKQSAKKWKSRTDGVEKSMKSKQEKRQQNIAKRKKEVKTNKFKKAEKKGRIILN